MKRLLNIFRVVAVVLLGSAVSCTDDYMGEKELPVAEEKPLELTLNICVPKVEESPRSRVLDPVDERALDKDAFHVILFQKEDAAQSGTPGEYVYNDTACWYSGSKIKWGEITSDGDRSIQSLQINLKSEFKNTSFILMAFANVYMLRKGNAPSNANRLPTDEELGIMKENILGKNYTEATLYQYMNGYVWPYGGQQSAGGSVSKWNIPMWGVSKPFSGNAAGIPPVSLLRALARVDVGVNIQNKVDGKYDLDNMMGKAPDSGDPFELIDVRVYNTRDVFRLNPLQNNLVDGKVTAASIVPGSNIEADPLVYKVSPYMSTREIYVPESDNKGRIDKNAFCLVIGGKYGDSSQPTYYRIDFYNRVEKVGDDTGLQVPPSPENRYDILRNFVYVVNILRVRGPGYTTPEVAVASKPINMEVEISEWEEGKDMTEVVTDGQYRLAASASELDYHSYGSRKGLSIYTDYLLEDYPNESGWKLSWEGMNDPNTTPVQFYDAAGNLIPSNEWHDRVLKGAAGIRTSLNVGMKRFEGASGERKVTLKFTAGRMSLDVVLTQDSRDVTSLKLTPSELSFTRDALLPQGVVMQARPTGEVELWAHWKDGTADRKYCFSHPEGHLGDNSPVPEMFNTANGGIFFRRGSGSNTWELKPTICENDPREMNFTIVAKWPDGLENSAPLNVKQSNLNVDWSVLQSQGGGPLKDQLLIFPSDGTSEELTEKAWISTGSNIEWYFSNYTETGNFSREKWLMNWENLNNVERTGPGEVSFQITPNPGLAKRRMTVWASSFVPGFDKTTSFVTLEQAGGDVHFRLLPGLETGNDDLIYDKDARKYTLDFGSISLPGWKRISVLANTNFWWAWNPDAMGDPSDIHLTPGDSRWGKILLNNFSSNVGEGMENATMDNSDAVDYTWKDALAFQSPRGPGVFPTEGATSDDVLKDMPKAGRYWASITLKNIHEQLPAEQVDPNALRLDIVRRMPSVVYIKWPLPDGANLGNYPFGMDSTLTLGTNNSLKCELQKKVNGEWQPLSTPVSDFIPTGDKYDKKVVANVLASLYSRRTAPGFNEQLETYRLLVSGPRQEVDGQPDNDNWSMSRIYYTGTKINCPSVANTTSLLLSDVRQVVVLDYSNSSYGKLDVRVTETDVDIVNGERLESPDARPDRITYYSLDKAKQQRFLIHYMAAHNDEDLASRRRMVKMTVEYWDIINNRWVKHQPESGRDWFVAQDASSYNGVVFYPTLLDMPAFPPINYSGEKILITKRTNEYLQTRVKEQEFTVVDFTGYSFLYVFRGGSNDIFDFTTNGDNIRRKFENYWKGQLYKNNPDIAKIPGNYRNYQYTGKGGVASGYKTFSFFGSADGISIQNFDRAGDAVPNGFGAVYLNTYTADYLSADLNIIKNAKAVGIRRASTTLAGTNISQWSAGKADKLDNNPHP